MDPGGRDRLDVRGSRCFSRSLLSLQALSYAGSRADVHAPALVESQTLREDGSVVKRFGLAWSDASPTNTLKTCPTSEREKQSPAQSPKPLGSISPRLSGVSLSACPTASGRLSSQSPLGFQRATSFVGTASWGPRADRRGQHGERGRSIRSCASLAPTPPARPRGPRLPGAHSPRGVPA